LICRADNNLSALQAGLDKSLMKDRSFLISASLSCHQSVDQMRLCAHPSHSKMCCRSLSQSRAVAGLAIADLKFIGLGWTHIQINQDHLIPGKFASDPR